MIRASEKKTGAERPAAVALGIAGGAGLALGLAGRFLTRRCSRDLERREALLLVVLSWAIGAALSGAPFLLWSHLTPALTGELAHGTTTWMTGLRTLADHVVPTITSAASAAGRGAPRVLAAIPVALTDDAEAAREACNRAFAIYPTLPSYKAMLDREGVEEPAGVALIGDEATLREGLARFRDAGVTDFAASAFPAGEGVAERTLAFMASEGAAG